MGHFLLSIFYSRGRIASVGRSSRLAFSFLVLAGIASLFGFPPTAIYFGFHFALAEAYMFQESGENVSELRRLTWARGVFALFLYFFLIRNQDPIQIVPWPVWLVGLIVSGLWCFFEGTKAAKFIPTSKLWDLITFEALGIILVCLLREHSIHYFLMIFYHVIEWMVISLRLPSIRHSKLRFAAEHLGIAVLFFIFMPVAGFVPLSMYYVWVFVLNSFGGYHTTLSLFTSDMNPMFLREFFRRRPSRAA